MEIAWRTPELPVFADLCEVPEGGLIPDTLEALLLGSRHHVDTAQTDVLTLHEMFKTMYEVTPLRPFVEFDPVILELKCCSTSSTEKPLLYDFFWQVFGS